MVAMTWAVRQRVLTFTRKDCTSRGGQTGSTERWAHVSSQTKHRRKLPLWWVNEGEVRHACCCEISLRSPYIRWSWALPVMEGRGRAAGDSVVSY